MAQQYGVPTNLFLWQIGQESSWDPNAHNSTPGSTATGLGQFINSTAQSFGIDPTNPYQSLQAAAQYDAQLYNQTGSWPAAMQAYGTTSGGTQIPSGLTTTTDTSNQSWWNEVLDRIWYGDSIALAGKTTTASGTPINRTIADVGTNVLTPIFDFLKQYSIVALGIVIIGLAIWSLLRRSETV